MVLYFKESIFLEKGFIRLKLALVCKAFINYNYRNFLRQTSWYHKSSQNSSNPLFWWNIKMILLPIKASFWLENEKMIHLDQILKQFLIFKVKPRDILYTLPLKSLGPSWFFWKKLIILFSKDALNSSKLVVKTYIILQKISIANKSCSIHRNPQCLKWKNNTPNAWFKTYSWRRQCAVGVCTCNMSAVQV